MLDSEGKSHPIYGILAYNWGLDKLYEMIDIYLEHNPELTEYDIFNDSRHLEGIVETAKIHFEQGDKNYLNNVFRYFKKDTVTYLQVGEENSIIEVVVDVIPAQARTR